MDRQTPFRNVRPQQNHATRNPLIAFNLSSMPCKRNNKG
jgi:hypothetical protein